MLNFNFIQELYVLLKFSTSQDQAEHINQHDAEDNDVSEDHVIGGFWDGKVGDFEHHRFSSFIP
jgi:hypothetical protein